MSPSPRKTPATKKKRSAPAAAKKHPPKPAAIAPARPAKSKPMEHAFPTAIGATFLAGVLLGALIIGPLFASPVGGRLPNGIVESGPLDPPAMVEDTSAPAASGDVSTATPGGFVLSRLPVVTIAQASDGGATQPAQLAIGTQAEWDKVWTDLPAVRRPARAIDFASEIAVVVFAGRQPTGGVTVGVTHVLQADSETRVYVSVVRPGPGCTATQAVTAPYVVVRIPRATEDVKFVVEEQTRSC